MQCKLVRLIAFDWKTKTIVAQDSRGVVRLMDITEGLVRTYIERDVGKGNLIFHVDDDKTK